ncbi:MAG: ubiquinol-cytochrome c reductase iron-sulfur subunit [Gemmatimonadaceae bacterium]
MTVNKKDDTSTGAERECNGCALVQSRRSFLRGSALAAIVASMGALGVPARAASGMSVGLISGRRRNLAGTHTVIYPLPPADGAQIDHDNDVIIVRWQNEMYAFNLSCPHQRTALRWDDADHRFECPKHHSKYQPDGEFISGRATRNMDRLTIRRDAGNNIVVDVDTMYRSDQDPAAWAAAVLKV